MSVPVGAFQFEVGRSRPMHAPHFWCPAILRQPGKRSVRDRSPTSGTLSLCLSSETAIASKLPAWIVGVFLAPLGHEVGEAFVDFRRHDDAHGDEECAFAPAGLNAFTLQSEHAA